MLLKGGLSAELERVRGGGQEGIRALFSLTPLLLFLQPPLVAFGYLRWYEGPGREIS